MSRPVAAVFASVALLLARRPRRPRASRPPSVPRARLLAFAFASVAALAAAQAPASAGDRERDDRRVAELHARWRAAWRGEDFRPAWLDDGRLLLAAETGADGAPAFVALAPEDGARLAPAADDPALRVGENDARRRGVPAPLFVFNGGATEVELRWLGGDGPKSYGAIPPGAWRKQPTYGGHRWNLRAADGRDLATFVAEDRPATAPLSAAGELLRRPRAASRPDPRRDDGRRGARERAASRRTTPPPSGPAAEYRIVDGALLGPGGAPVGSAPTAESRYVGRPRPSPDGRRVLAYRATPGAPGRLRYVEVAPPGERLPRLHDLEYARPGDRVEIRRPELFDAATGRALPVDDAHFRDAFGLRDDAWAPDGSEFRAVVIERGHAALRLLAIDGETGRARVVIEERSPTFVDYAHAYYYRPLADERTALWMSEREGRRSLYRVDLRTGAVVNRVAAGPWIVRDVEDPDEAAGEVVVAVGGYVPGQDPYYVHYLAAKLDGSAHAALTEGDGTHEIEISPDGRALVDRWSRVDLPPQAVLRRRADGRALAVLATPDYAALRAAGWSPPERFRALGADGVTEIYGVVFRPADFDPRRKYPVVEHVYAGPQGFFTPKEFAVVHHHRELADRGFIVVQADGRGTAGRTKAFHDVAWRNVAEAGFDDRVAWLRAAAAHVPAMDLERVGIYGTSAGGQSALRALIAHHDVYRAAVADCGCHDNRVDKLWWNELWMGLPPGPHYDEQSNVVQAHRVRGELLLAVGAEDRNVDPASTMQVVDALVKAGRDFELLVAPGVGHGVLGTPYGRRRLVDFFRRTLGGPTPAGG